MCLFRSKYVKELDAIISRIEMNMANNYKDNAQSDLRELEETFGKFVQESLLKDKDITVYEARIKAYQEKLKGYSHKDQKPYWTK